MKRTAALAVAAALAACATTAPPPAVREPPAAAAPRSYTPRVVEPARPLECVPYARERSGLQIFGDAHTWPTQAAGRYPILRRPYVGAVLALGGTSGGHLAYVTAILSEREILVDHANWGNDGRIHLDAPVRDVSTRGDWSQVRVWHMGVGALGLTAYPVHGFILEAEPVALDISGYPWGNPARGRRIAAQCHTCHSLAAGDNRIGPSLHGVIGRRAGSVEGFPYSEANKASGLTWSEQQLWTYLENPQRSIRGTIMAFAGIKDPQQRADVIAYLKTIAQQP